MKRTTIYQIERTSEEGWVNLSGYCEDVYCYYDRLEDAVKAFDRYLDSVNDGCHTIACRIMAIGLHCKSVVMTGATF